MIRGGEGQHSLSQYDGRCLSVPAISRCGSTAGKRWIVGAVAADRARSAVVREHPASEIKAMCSTLEQSHPLGWWDIDVICPQNGLVGRQSLGEAAPLPGWCDEPAHAWRVSRRHDTDLVVARVEQMIDAGSPGRLTGLHSRLQRATGAWP